MATTLGGWGSLTSHGCAVHLWGLGGRAGSPLLNWRLLEGGDQILGDQR